MRDILSKMKVADLKKEISKTNIKGYSKMKKSELIDLMVKNKEKFSHLSKGAPAPKVEPAKAKPKKKAEPKEARFTLTQALEFKKEYSPREKQLSVDDTTIIREWKRETGSASAMGFEDDTARVKRIKKRLNTEYRRKFKESYEINFEGKVFTREEWELEWLVFQQEENLKRGLITKKSLEQSSSTDWSKIRKQRIKEKKHNIVFSFEKGAPAKAKRAKKPPLKKVKIVEEKPKKQLTMKEVEQSNAFDKSKYKDFYFDLAEGFIDGKGSQQKQLERAHSKAYSFIIRQNKKIAKKEKVTSVKELVDAINKLSYDDFLDF